jgi:hypothetical protein
VDGEAAAGQGEGRAAHDELTVEGVILVENIGAPADGIIGKLTLGRTILAFQSTSSNGRRLTAVVDVGLSRAHPGFMMVHSNDGTEAVTYDFGDTQDGRENSKSMAQALRGRITAGRQKQAGGERTGKSQIGGASGGERSRGEGGGELCFNLKDQNII